MDPQVLFNFYGIEFFVLDDVKDVVKGFLQFLFEEKKASVGLRMSIDNMGMDYGMNFVHAPPLKWVGVHVCLIYAERKLYLAIQNVPNFNSWSMEKIQSIFFLECTLRNFYNQSKTLSN